MGEAGANEQFLALPEALLRNYSIGQSTPQPALLVPRTPLCNTVKHVVHCVGNTVNQLQLFNRGSNDQSLLTARCSAPEQQKQKQIPKHASKRKRNSSNSNSSDTVKTKAASSAAAAAAASASETNTSANCLKAASSNRSSNNVKDPNVKDPNIVQGNETNNRTSGGSDNAVLKRPKKGSAAAVKKTTAKLKTTTRPRQQRNLLSKSTSEDTTTMHETSWTSHKKKASTRKRRRTKSDKDDEDGNNDKGNENGKQPKTLPVFAPTTARSRADLELFARTKVDILQAEYLSNVQALRQKLEVLQARSKSMTARHEIHAKRDVDAHIVRVETELTMLESGNVLRKFKQEAACVLFAYDNLVLEQNGDADEVAKKGVEVVVQEDQANALPPATFCSSTSRNLESARTVSDEASHSSLNEEIVDDDNKEQKAASSDGGVEVSSIVADEDSGSVIERRRHVSKPDMRVLTRGQNHAAAVADSFLERNGGLVTKPMCCISDTHCIRCQGQLVLDVSSDLFVCVDCHFEQSTTHSSEHSIGYGNTSSVTFNSCRYTRETHFINYLDRFGGCVGSEKITDELVVSVMKWMKDRGVAADAVSAQIVTMALHDLGYRELKQHKVIIMARITGVKPKSFSPEQRTQLIDMFRQVSRAFDELRRKGRFPHRVNFLSYRYTIFKFLEMLTWGEEFKTSFEVLKGPGNLENQDEYWKCICDYLGFHFIPTAPLVQVHIDLSPHCAVCSQPKTLVCANCHN